MAKYDFSSVKEHSEKRFADKTLVGCGSMVNVCGETVFEGYYGNASVEKGTAIKRDSIYRMASMTKPLTGVSVMQLVEKGKIDLFAPVSKYLPKLTKMGIAGRDKDGNIIKVGDAKRDFTVFELMSHCSGFAQGELGYEQCGKYPETCPKEGDTLKDKVPTFSNKILLDSQPGEAMGYGAITAFDTLSYLVELASDMSYGEYLKKNLTGPLGMVDTTFHPTEEQRKRLVSIYEADGNIKAIPESTDNMLGVPNSYEGGSCAILSTVPDYMNFTEMLQNGGTFNGTHFLNEITVRFMSTPLTHPTTAGWNQGQVWGLSMRVVTNPNGTLPLGSFGWSGAYGTHFFICPTKKISAVYCSNLTNAGGAGAPTAFEFEEDVMASIK